MDDELLTIPAGVTQVTFRIFGRGRDPGGAPCGEIQVGMGGAFSLGSAAFNHGNTFEEYGPDEDG